MAMANAQVYYVAVTFTAVKRFIESFILRNSQSFFSYLLFLIINKHYSPSWLKSRININKNKVNNTDILESNMNSDN
jgi:hypothetical protein